MSDIEIKLEPQDEYNHVPDEATNYNESMYFNVFDHGKKMGGWFRLGNRVNEGYAEMTCCIYLPDGRIGFMFGRPEISTNEVFDAGGMIAVTNDGPKGPAKIAKSGSIGLAIKKNVNIITVTGSASRFWELNSWDKTLIPKPFGKIQLVVSKPLKIVKKPKDSKEEVDILTTFINIHQDVADNITGKI